MKKIYEIGYAEKWTGGRWVEDDVKVAGNGSGEDAIAKARRWCLRKSYKTDDGKVRKVIGFKMLSVKVIAEADI